MRYILIFVNGFIFSQPSDNESPQEISIKKKQADLTEAAQEKVKGVIEQAVENKLHKEKITRKLTVKFIITGVAVAGAFLLVNNADKIANLLTKPKEE